MPEIVPSLLDVQDTAKLLLKLAGPERRNEVHSGTGPIRFMVPPDIAQAYENTLKVLERADAETRSTAKTPKRGRRMVAVAESLGTGEE